MSGQNQSEESERTPYQMLLYGLNWHVKSIAEVTGQSEGEIITALMLSDFDGDRDWGVNMGED